MGNAPWHVLHVLSNHEKQVAKHLAVRSVEHYLPLYTERVKWTDRTVIAERPLFAGYVFAHFSPQNRRAITSIPGAHRVLGDEDRDLVSHAEIERIREGLTTGLLLRPHACTAVGTRVRVRGGVFGGVEGVVADLRRQCKVIITLSGGCQSFSLEVGLEDLESINPPCRTPQWQRPSDPKPGEVHHRFRER
jgi:transcription antitermination factor NusG